MASPRPVPLALRGNERHEQPVHHVRRDTGAVVAHAQLDASIGHATRAEGDAAAGWAPTSTERFDGVANEGQHHLLQLCALRA